ncbi:hypothetical protein GCM10009525_17440 [Streptosporangium amethystogenes subsp. fukuiense]
MGDPTGRPASWVSCRLLLIALVLGVAGMHTLGHLNHQRVHGNTPAAFGHSATADHGVREARPMFRPAPMPQAEQLISKLGDTPLTPDPGSVCLAVLTSFLLLIGMASMRTWRTSQARAAGASPRPLLTRPPPRRTALRLARLSVLRV